MSPRRESADEKWSRWTAHIDKILQEIYRAHLYRVFWRGLADMTRDAALPASGIFDAFTVWYATTQAVAVRRQLDRDRRVISLRRLLDEIATYPHVASRSRHMARWMEDGGDHDHFEAEGNDNFDRFAGGREHAHIDVALVRADIALLRAAGEAVERYTHDYVAHMAAEPVHEVPTFVELNAAIDQIGTLAQKYASLLKAEMVWQLEPVIQYDWKAPFRQAWLDEEE